MISCTEFIPLYSEFFKYLEKRGGRDAVMDYWIYISDNSIADKTNPNSLISFIERDGGFEGAINYWNHTLTEEACDVLKIHDYEKRYSYSHMRHCPSRGMLNSLPHVEPYHDYCGHCKVIYARVLEKYGIDFEMDHSKIGNAECSYMFYERGKRPQGDYTKIDGTKVVVDMKAEDNKYLHRDFHLLGDLALKYCAETFGDGAVRGFLADYTKHFYSPIIEKIKADGLQALKLWREKTYETEEASHLLHSSLSDNTLEFTVDRCPAIEFMHSLGQKPTEYYAEETKTVLSVIAEQSGLLFELDYYKEDGAAKYRFIKKS